MEMDSVEEAELPADINLVRLDKPQLVYRNTQTKQSRFPKTNVSSSTFEDNVSNRCLKCNDVLDKIMPDKEWMTNGKLYRQKISKQPGAKSDIKKLNEKLDMYLKQFDAREVGICPITEQLYLQCFNEIIRQVTINCPLRGSMLIRVRDEIKTNLDSYQKLFESVTALGIRKSLLLEEKKTNLMEAREKLRIENEKLEAESADTNAKTEQFEQEMAEKKKAENARHAEDLAELKKSNQMIKAQMESIIDPKNRMH